MRCGGIIKLKMCGGIKGVKREKSRFYATWPLVLVAYCNRNSDLTHLKTYNHGVTNGMRRLPVSINGEDDLSGCQEEYSMEDGRVTRVRMTNIDAL